MKTRLLIIIGIVLSTIIAISIISTQSFDTQEYSKENPYGFSAHVVYSKDSLPFMCPTQNDCDTHLQLNIDSDIPAILKGYEICNGLSCVSKNNITFSSRDSSVIPIFDGSKWNTGDKVSIKVQVITQYRDDETHPESPTFYINLGESEITEHEKTVKVEGMMAQEICAVIKGDCPEFYLGSFNQNGSVIVNHTIYGRGWNAHLQFLIQNETLSYVKTVKQNEN